MGSSDFTSRRARALAAGAVLALSSCTFLFDPGGLQPGGDAGPPDNDDGGGNPPDAIPPGQFGLARLEPPDVYEGEGAAWPVPIIVRGQNIAATATVEIDGAGLTATPVTATVSGDGSVIVFPLTAPVLDLVGEGATERITVTVRSDGKTDTLPITVKGLDEFVASALPDTNPIDSASLRPLYSRIVIDRDVTFNGNAPVRLVATSEIRLESKIDANGQDGLMGTGGQGGPGGCSGGAAQSNGECDIGGGEGGGADDAPGGGGHFTIGTPGAGGSIHPGGMPTGRPEIVPLEDEHGNGGGGALNAAGGGGGGIVELTSQGTFAIGPAGRIEAEGGRGAEGRCNQILSEGSGGGGSGGAILVRAFGGFDDQSTDIAVSVRGGEGGSLAPETTCPEIGGAGSFGRLRADTPDLGGVPSFALGQPTPFQGALFRNSTVAGQPVPVVASLPMLSLDLVGEPERTFYLDVNGGSRQPALLSAAGTATVLVQLQAGNNRICVVMDQATPIGLSEGVQCISIAHIP